MNIESRIEKVREEMYECIEKYDRTDHRTVSKSQELDLLLNIYNGQTVCA